MDKEYHENPAIFPPAEMVAKCEPALYLGEEATKLARRDLDPHPGGIGCLQLDVTGDGMLPSPVILF